MQGLTCTDGLKRFFRLLMRRQARKACRGLLPLTICTRV